MFSILSTSTRICDLEHFYLPIVDSIGLAKFYVFSLCISAFHSASSSPFPIPTCSTVVRVHRVTRARSFTCAAPLTHPRARRLISHENLLHRRVYLDDVRFIGPFYRRQLNGTIRLVRRRDFILRAASHFVFAVSIQRRARARR